MTIQGIYCIENTTNNKKYIGSSCDIYNRWATHKYQLRRNTHANKHLQSSWELYGEEKFRFGILEELAGVTEELMLEREKDIS